MTIRNNAKFEKELTCSFKTDIRNLTNFDSSTQKSKIFLGYNSCFKISFNFVEPYHEQLSSKA